MAYIVREKFALDRKDENELLALISSSVHDMKAPLTAISGFVGAILDGTLPEEKHAHYLGVIRDEAERMRLICDELLAASRIEAGAEKYELKPLDICELARKTLLSMENAVEKKGLEVRFFAPDEGIIIQGDESALTRLLYNIFDNAVKFSYNGGYLAVTFKNDGEIAYVRIENSGDGISEEELEKVFAPFYKSGVMGGSGLGMFIAKKIAEAHGGSLAAESRVHEWTAFTVGLNRG